MTLIGIDPKPQIDPFEFSLRCSSSFRGILGIRSFEAAVRPNGDIVARGSQDMKCVGMAYLEAIRRLKLAHKESSFKRSIHLLFTPDEEIGSANGATQMIKDSTAC